MEHEVEIDRHAIWVNDLVLTERFYVDVLGEILPSYIANRYMLSTEEIVRERQMQALAARGDGEGHSQSFIAVPYARAMVGHADVIFRLLDHHVQEPPLEQLRGRPRLALSVSAEQMDRAPDVLRGHEVPFEGPVDHAPPAPIARSLYFKDPSGNFLELCCPRA
jgi:catechol 2,3-dioxygenase-like lactoylglutathione lyase family enzyme